MLRYRHEIVNVRDAPRAVSWPIYVSNLLAGMFLSGFNLALFSLTLEGLPTEARAGEWSLWALARKGAE